MNTSTKSARGHSIAVKSQIDENLKRVYEHALKEEVPDRFKLLLEQLKGGVVLSSAATPAAHPPDAEDAGASHSVADPAPADPLAAAQSADRSRQPETASWSGTAPQARAASETTE